MPIQRAADRLQLSRSERQLLFNFTDEQFLCFPSITPPPAKSNATGGLRGGRGVQSCSRTSSTFSSHAHRSSPAARGDGSRGHLGNTVTHSGHDSPPPPSYTSVSEQDLRSAIAIWLPSCSNASYFPRRATPGAALAAQPAATPGAQGRRHGKVRHGTPAAHLAAAPGELRGPRLPAAEQKGSRHRPVAPGGSAASPPASARPSPAQVACGIAEPQLGRLPSPRTERRGSWRHVNDVLSYFH